MNRMKKKMGDLSRAILIIAILSIGLCGIASADTGGIGGVGKPGENSGPVLRFRDTINIDGKVWAGSDTKYGPASEYPIDMYLEVYPVNHQDPATMPKVKKFTPIYPDSNGHFSIYFTNMEPDDLIYNYLVFKPVVPDMKKVELVRKESDPDVFVENSGTPYVIFDLTAMRKKGGPTVNAKVEWRVTPLSVANLPKTGVAYIEPEINPSIIFGTKVTQCMDITEPGYYVLQNDISTDEYSCIQILSSDVVFNGNNKKIHSGTKDNYKGYYSDGILVTKNNVTITNVDVSGWPRGIKFADCSDGIIRDSNIHENHLKNHHDLMSIWVVRESGIWLFNTTNVQIINNSIENNLMGVVVENGHNNIIGGLPPCQSSSHQGFYTPGISALYDFNQIVFGNFGNEINANEIGILLDDTSGNKVIHNTLYNNGLDERNGYYVNNNYPIEKYGSPVYGYDPSGIALIYSNDNDIKMNSVTGSRGDGLLIKFSSGNRIYANGFNYNKKDGIHIAYDSSENTIQSNFIGVPFNRGMPTTSECDTTYNPCEIIQHFGSGLFIAPTSGNNIIFNNKILPYFISIDNKDYLVNVDTKKMGSPPETIFTTSEKIPGPNIVGGPTIGGNYWGNCYHVPGSPPECPDTNNDGFSDMAFCAFRGDFCVEPQPNNQGADVPPKKKQFNPAAGSASLPIYPGIDHYPLISVQPLIQSRQMLYLSPALTGDLCENPLPDATWKYSGVDINQFQKPAGFIPLPPTQSSNVVQAQLPNRGVVSLVDKGSITQPSLPTSLFTRIVSIPQTIISFVQGSPAPDIQATGSVSVIDIPQGSTADAQAGSMHVVVLPERDEQHIVTIQDSGKIVPIITPALPEPQVVIIQEHMIAGPEGTPDVTPPPPPEPRAIIPDNYIGSKPQIAPFKFTCPAGYNTCNGQCVDLMTDTAYCGSCNSTCPSQFTCVAGMCNPQCNSDQILCNRVCANLLTDPANCGTCRNICTNGAACENGQCVLPSVKIRTTRLGDIGKVRF